MKGLDPENPYLLYYGEWFKKSFTDFIVNPKYSYLIDKILERRYTNAEIGETYRTINSWDSAGLLLLNEDRDSKWRRFNLVDFVWILIIRELRNIGFSIDKILNVMQNLFYDFPQTDDNLKLEYVLFFISEALMNNDISLIVRADGICTFVLDIQYFGERPAIDPFENDSSYIVINFNKILAKALNKPKIPTKNMQMVALTKELSTILSGIYAQEDVKEVVVQMKDGNVKRVHKKMHSRISPLEPIAEIREILKNNNNQDITIHQQDGKIVSYEQIIKT